jgi:hypothetical protein
VSEEGQEAGQQIGPAARGHCGAVGVCPTSHNFTRRTNA